MDQRRRKAELRARMRAKLHALPAETCEENSRRIAELLPLLDVWHRAQVILIFMSMDHEVRTDAVIAHALSGGKTVGVPRMYGELIEFHSIIGLDGPWDDHAYGIKEPPESAPLLMRREDRRRTLVVTPGCAFDLHGGRLGNGKGYYDKFLRTQRALRTEPGEFVAVGVGYDIQVVDRVPMTPHDEKLDGLVTESGPVYPTGGRIRP